MEKSEPSTASQLQNILQLTFFMFLFLIKPIRLKSDPYVYCSIELSVLLFIIFLIRIWQSGRKDVCLSVPVLLAPHRIRFRRNIVNICLLNLIQQWNHILHSPSSSTLMCSNTKSQRQHAETFSYSAKKQQNSNSSL